MPRSALFDVASLDLDHVVADIEAIREHNPQRYEFEQLSWICHMDVEAGDVAGVLEIPEDVWWGRGHCPGRPLMPGVLMLECAAQLCSWFVHQVYDSSQKAGRIFGFGGIDDVKYRGIILPPARLVVIGKRVEVRPRRAVFDTQGYLADDLSRMVFEARITGMWV
ncbi:MAG: beta-hydroxyacyl-ACP dehydratase [Planctomycetes bacterium]|nr:beta-hydroxyacyl-ACP dehydratase [Planctomycetota bacterium]MCB9830019.1 beta-hydroxyacyl-ACP dehydratase [Planctomycetota bacterium]